MKAAKGANRCIAFQLRRWNKTQPRCLMIARQHEAYFLHPKKGGQGGTDIAWNFYGMHYGQRKFGQTIQH